MLDLARPGRDLPPSRDRPRAEHDTYKLRAAVMIHTGGLRLIFQRKYPIGLVCRYPGKMDPALAQEGDPFVVPSSRLLPHNSPDEGGEFERAHPRLWYKFTHVRHP